jgi:quercetin dioxygenase-like cupin family protein
MSEASITQWDFAPGADTGTGLVPGDGASLRRVNVPAGRKADRHSHAHEQFLLVVSGAGRLECEAGAVELRPGTVLRFAPGAWHSAEFTVDTVLVEVNLAEETAA